MWVRGEASGLRKALATSWQDVAVDYRPAELCSRGVGSPLRGLRKVGPLASLS